MTKITLYRPVSRLKKTGEYKYEGTGLNDKGEPMRVSFKSKEDIGDTVQITINQFKKITTHQQECINGQD